MTTRGTISPGNVSSPGKSPKLFGLTGSPKEERLFRAGICIPTLPRRESERAGLTTPPPTRKREGPSSGHHSEDGSSFTLLPIAPKTTPPRIHPATRLTRPWEGGERDTSPESCEGFSLSLARCLVRDTRTGGGIFFQVSPKSRYSRLLLSAASTYPF